MASTGRRLGGLFKGGGLAELTNVGASAMGRVGDGDPADRAGGEPLLLEDVIMYDEGEV